MDLELEGTGNSFRAGKGEGETEVWKLECSVDWEPERITYVIWFIFYTLRAKGSLPPQSGVRAFLREAAGAEHGVQRKARTGTRWWQAGALWLLLTFWLHFPMSCDISGSLSHFPWLPFPPYSLYFFLVSSIMVIYIVLPPLLKPEVKFSVFWLLYH